MQSLNVLLHYTPGPAWRRQLADLGSGLQITCCSEFNEDDFYARLPGIDVLWHVLRPLSAEDIKRATRLRLIQKIALMFLLPSTAPLPPRPA